MERVKAATANTNRPLWGAKIIYSTIRFIEPGVGAPGPENGVGRLRWYLEDCIALKREFPDLIAGELFPVSVLARQC